MPLLYHWRGDNYRRDLDFGAGYHLNESNPLLHEIDIGDSLWAFTRRSDGLFSPEQRGEALAAARAIGDEEARARALRELAPHLPPEQREAAIIDILAAAEAFPRPGVLHFTEGLIATKILNPSVMAAAILEAQAMWP